MSSSVPIHARNHRTGGVDPIGGVAVDLGRYVIAAVPQYRNLWVGGHDPMTSGDEGVTTIACPLITTAGPAPLSNKFYDHSETPVWTSTVSYSNGYLGCDFHALIANVQCTGVQFWSPGGGSGNVKLWRNSDGAELASGSGGVGAGWNEIYFAEPHPILSTGVQYTVGVPFGDRPTGDGGAGGAMIPLTADGLAEASAGAPWRRHVTAGLPDPPATGSIVNYAIGPILDHTPIAGNPYIVATASHGTDSGVFIHRTEKGANLINIFWSATDAIVAANVFVMGLDPGDTQPCATENYYMLGECRAEED